MTILEHLGNLGERREDLFSQRKPIWGDLGK
jgi:hypothetical protein